MAFPVGDEGAANPWGVNVSPDGKTLWASASGSHQVLRVDLTMLHKLLAGPIPTELVKAGGKAPTATSRAKGGYARPCSPRPVAIPATPASTTPI